MDPINKAYQQSITEAMEGAKFVGWTKPDKNGYVSIEVQYPDGRKGWPVMVSDKMVSKTLKKSIFDIMKGAHPSHYLKENETINEGMGGQGWGSSDQYAMNMSIHKQLGKPKQFVSPFDKKLRSAAEDAVDFYWDDWKDYARNRDGLIDHAVKLYLLWAFPKEMEGFAKLFGVR